MSRLGSFDRLPHHRARGAAAEDAAETYLRSLGLRIVARNVTSHLGELDLVALDGETLCFVEIKARTRQATSRSLLKSLFVRES